MRRLTIVIYLLIPIAFIPAAEIRLKDQAECAGPLVRLGDIAEIGGEATADGSLADLVLFPSPAQGKSRLVRQQELRQLLALCDLEMHDCQLTGAEAVEIKPAASHTRTIVRPAWHLIPAQSHVRNEPRELGRPGGEQKPEAPIILVKRNAIVTVHSLAAGVKITTSGKSLADAAAGESVLVELDDSREKILARVAGPQLVEIRAGGR